MNVKKIWEDHKGAICAVGGIALGTGLIFLGGYMCGKDAMLSSFKKSTRIQSVFEGLEHSEMMYSSIFSPEKMKKFKDLGELAKDAIEFDPSHLNDDIVALYVMTNSGT